MGYYSDVRFNTTKAGYEEFLAALPDGFMDNDGWYLFDRYGRPEVYEDYGTGIIFGWDSVKWYLDWGLRNDGSDPFADVKAVMAAYRKVRDNELHPIQYVRVGEEDFDVDDEGTTSTDTEELDRYIGTETRIYWY